ncbi:hypothetical protein G7Y79_00048g083690 [Physcia stellaris]|nr:hypothetical protein G7Y79_00048g083690 [Physcia stellaris]
MTIKPPLVPPPSFLLHHLRLTLNPHPLLPRPNLRQTRAHPFLHAHLKSSPSRRPSGRRPSKPARHPSTPAPSPRLRRGTVVRIGDTAGALVPCTPRAKKLKEDETSRRKRRKTETDEIARLNLLVPNIELSTGCSPAHLPGSPPSALAQTLSYRVLTLLHSQLVEAEDLRIWHHPPNPNDPASITSEAKQ